MAPHNKCQLQVTGPEASMLLSSTKFPPVSFLCPRIPLHSPCTFSCLGAVLLLTSSDFFNIIILWARFTDLHGLTLLEVNAYSVSKITMTGLSVISDRKRNQTQTNRRKPYCPVLTALFALIVFLIHGQCDNRMSVCVWRGGEKGRKEGEHVSPAHRHRPQLDGCPVQSLVQSDARTPGPGLTYEPSPEVCPRRLGTWPSALRHLLWPLSTELHSKKLSLHLPKVSWAQERSK